MLRRKSHTTPAWTHLKDPYTKPDAHCIDRLLSVLVSEANAASNCCMPLRLVNPTTGEVEEWVAVLWRNVLGSHLPDAHPRDWPSPWIRESH